MIYEVPVSLKVRLDSVNPSTGYVKMSLLIGEHVLYSKTMIASNFKDENIAEYTECILQDYAYHTNSTLKGKQ